MRYLAIDFETANANRSSICAFGYALFEDCNLITSGSELCRPEPNYYEPWNTRIHGIQFDDTNSLGDFSRLITKIDDYAPDFLVAHNASFDISCLRHWCDLANSAYPQYSYICTLILSRLVYPEFISHGLGAICKIHEIPLKHHDAGSDAMACGLLLGKFIEQLQTNNINDIYKKLDISKGMLFENEYYPCVSNHGIVQCTTKRHKHGKISDNGKISDIRCSSAVNKCSPLYQSKICFTGELTFATRREAAIIAAERGAIPQDAVTSETSYLVVGLSDFIDLDIGQKTTKMKKAEDLKAGSGAISTIIDSSG